MAGEYGPREKWTKAPPSTSLRNRDEKSDADRGNFARPRRLQFQGFSRRRRTNPTSGGTSDGYHALASTKTSTTTKCKLAYRTEDAKPDMPAISVSLFRN